MLMDQRSDSAIKIQARSSPDGGAGPTLGNSLRSAESARAGGGHRVALDQDVSYHVIDHDAGFAIFTATNAP